MLSYILSFLLLISFSSCEDGTKPINKNETDKSETDTVVAIAPAPDKFARTPFVYDSTKTYIYLTFDDGPQNGTMQCFNLCKELGVKASFFMVGNHARDKWGKDIVSSIREAYPQILLANHSTTHANNRYHYFYTHPIMAAEDFYKAQESMNVPYKIIRLPGNTAWVSAAGIKSTGLVRPVCKLLDSAGYNVLGWDVEWHFRYDGTSRPVQSAEKIISQTNYAATEGNLYTKKHVMILTHDRMFRQPSDLDSLRKYIVALKSNPQYVFETVDHYPGMRF